MQAKLVPTLAKAGKSLPTGWSMSLTDTAALLDILLLFGLEKLFHDLLELEIKASGMSVRARSLNSYRHGLLRYFVYFSQTGVVGASILDSLGFVPDLFRLLPVRDELLGTGWAESE